MKRLLILIALASSAAHSADWLLVPAVSYHVERTQNNGKPWNEVNAGLGFVTTCLF